MAARIQALVPDPRACREITWRTASTPMPSRSPRAAAWLPQRPDGRTKNSSRWTRLPQAAVAPAAARGQASSAGAPAAATPPPDPNDANDQDIIEAGLVGSGGGGLTALVFA